MGIESGLNFPPLAKSPEEAPSEPVAENKIEKEKPFDFDFFITDHSADLKYDYSDEELTELYAEIKKDGVGSIRYDWRWKEIEKESGKIEGKQLESYKKAKNSMAEVGLSAPTIILSDVPDWALEQYKKGNKDEFFISFEAYVEKVKDSLVEVGGEKVDRVQILNELNNAFYTPIKTEDLPRMCEITRNVFKDYNENIKLVGSLNVGNIQELAGKLGYGQGIKEYLPEFKKIKDNFDIISLDYYPGLWHLPMKEAGWKHKNTFKQLKLLKETFEEVATWGKEYEIDEVGLPTNRPWGNEKKQRYFYDVFLRSLKQLMIDMRSRDIQLPSRIGFYEAVDETPNNLVGKILRKTTPFPEHDMGIREKDKTTGELMPKLVARSHLPENEPKGAFGRVKKYFKGRKYTEKPEEAERHVGWLIRYMRAPVKKNK